MVKGYRNRVGSKTGGLKLYKALKPEFIKADIKIGRDKFYEFLRYNKLLVPVSKSYRVTTNSKHMFRKYKNLVKDKIPTRPEQLWVSDITYIKTETGHNYLAIVTDAYSKKIMGYKIDKHMKTSLCMDALKMALKNRIYKDKALIHHSDRGLQYCNPKYVHLANQNGIKMSMTEQYDPYENAIAERINKTLKYEYGLKETLKNTKIAAQATRDAVTIYNNLRLHYSLNLRTPNDIHKTPDIEYKSYRKNDVNLPKLTI